MEKSIFNIKINNKNEQVIIFKTIQIKPEVRNAKILLVKPSTKIKAIIQEVDEYGELQGFDKTIICNKSDLVKSEETVENLSGKKYFLYTLARNENKKFAIIETDILEYEPTDRIVNNVSKYKVIFNKKEKSNKKVSKFKNVTKVKMLWDNYYKVLFTALPAIKPQNLKGVSILTILLKIFGEIPAFIVYFINSIVISFSVVFLTLFTSLLAAYAFARLEWAGRDKIFLLYLSTMMIPGQVTTIPVFILVKKLGWIDTYKVLILPAAFMTWGVFMLRQFFLSIPVDLEEAAIIDGSTKVGILFKIILPLSKAALATLFVFRFKAVWNNLMGPLIFTNSAYMKTIPLGLASFQGLYSTDWTLLMAATVIATVPIILVFIFNQKYFTEGIQLSGLKG